MINKTILCIAFQFIVGGLLAQNNFSFENEIPEQWSANKGALSIDNDRYKDGNSSLRWEASAKNPLLLKFDSFVANKATAFYIYSQKATNDTLFIDFKEGGTLKKQAKLVLNFAGWRSFNRAYSSYSTAKATNIDNITFQLNAKAQSQTLFIDDVQLNRKVDPKFQHGYHMLNDKDWITSGEDHLYWYCNSVDINKAEPTKAELELIEKLVDKYSVKKKKPTEDQLAKARSFVSSFDIKKNADKTLKGNAINTMEALEAKLMVEIAQTLEALAFSDNNQDREQCQIFIDFLLDQGIAEGVNYYMQYGQYGTMRVVPRGFLATLSVCRDDQYSEILKLVRWITEYGKLYNAEDKYLAYLNADAVTNMLSIYYAIALSEKDNTIVLRDLKAITRYLNRHTSYVPGNNDILKIDGTGYHHKAHYNGYMYSLDHWINMAYELKGSSLKVSNDAYGRMKKAVISMYILSPRAKDNERYTANSLSGRNPFSKNGSKVQVTKASFKKLIEIGNDLGDDKLDEELASAYNYFFKTDEYKAANKQYDGFYQFNYSPIGVYRNDNWTAVMRSPTTKFWTAEIYNKTNRLGRYQGHGSLEVIYEGGLANSGYPTNTTLGGWDWNVIPGATTVHYTSWQEMMPAKNIAQRFDQYTKTKNFSGALAWNDKGVFAADFDQGDNWGKSHFEATNLVFKKSVFAFDKILISMGSDIGASGNYGDDMITATNIFQSIITSKSKPLVVNKKTITEAYSETIEKKESNWLINPQSTGFIIPKGNDPLVIKYGKQKSPSHTGDDVDDPKTELLATKAYINHGVKTMNNKYLYITVPNTNEEELLKLNQKIRSSSDNDIYQVLYQESDLHALLYKSSNTTAYSFFEPKNNIDKGMILSSFSQLLLMVKEDGNKLMFAANNPNLNPKDDKTYGWISSPTQASIIVKGKWRKSESKQDNIDLVVIGENTQISFTLSEGEPIYFDIKK